MEDGTLTVDPRVVIEAEGDGWVIYQRTTDGARWRVDGVCDYRGDCLVGAVDPLLGPRETRLDVPVTPDFSGCCPLVGTWL